MMDVFWTQLTILLCLVVGNILFGSLPSLLGKLVGLFSNSEDEWNRRVKLASCLLYVGAGIFISDTFVVLLPKTNHEFTKSALHSHEQKNNATDHQDQHVGHHHDSIPLPEFIILCSFFFAYVLQEIITYILTKFKRTSKIFVGKRISYCTCAKRHTECSRTFKDARADQTLYGLGKKLQESGRIPNATAADINVIPPAEATAKAELLRSSIIVQPMPNYGAVTNVTEPPIDNPLPVLQSPVLLTNEKRIAMEQHIQARYQNKFLINSILITVALTLQFALLGIHLGLETERFHQFTYFILCLQNFLLNFSAGSYLVIGNLKFFYTAIIIGLLSFISPIGLIFVMLDKTAAQELPHLFKGVLFAIACGILLYTIFCGMLRQKNIGHAFGSMKFLAILMGAGIMISLQYLISTL